MPAATRDARYLIALNCFDKAVCEACAVGNATSNEVVRPAQGLATHVFARTCGAGVTTMRSVPLSVWREVTFEHWDVSAIAGQVRSILESYLLILYLVSVLDDDHEQQAAIQVMHMYDCRTRLRLFGLFLPEEETEKFREEAEKIETTLKKPGFHAPASPSAKRSSCGENSHYPY